MKRLLAILLLGPALACSPPAKHETAVLAAAVDRYRRAENASKPDLAAATAAVPCTDAEVCAARDACVAAMVPTARALVLKDEVAKKMDDIEGGRLAKDDPEATELRAKLEEARRLLADGKGKWEPCEHGLAELRMKWGT
jgi:hypothetical protein